MSDPAYPAFSVLILFAAVLVLIPLPWHLQSLNAGTCLFMIWTSIACLNLGVNSIVWHGNAIDVAPVWCDICKFLFQLCGVCPVQVFVASRIIVASAVAIPAASFCINRRLYKIATIQSVSISHTEVCACLDRTPHLLTHRAETTRRNS